MSTQYGVTYTVSRDPSYIQGIYNTSPDLIRLTPDGYVCQLISNKGYAEPLVTYHGTFAFGGDGGGRGAMIASDQPISGDAMTAYTMYGNYPQKLAGNQAVVDWIAKNYPATFNYWVKLGAITQTEIINAPPVPINPTAKPLAPVVGDTPYTPIGTTQEIDTAIHAISVANAQSGQTDQMPVLGNQPTVTTDHPNTTVTNPLTGQTGQHGPSTNQQRQTGMGLGLLMLLIGLGSH